MIGDYLALLLAHHAVFLFFSDKYLFNGVKQVFLAYIFSARLNGIDCRLIDHIGEIGTDCAGSCQCNLVQINRLIHPHILGMYLQDFHTSF